MVFELGGASNVKNGMSEKKYIYCLFFLGRIKTHTTKPIIKDNIV